MGRGGGLVLLDQGATWTGVGVVALSALLLALGILLFARWRRVVEREAAQIRAAGERTEKLLTELSLERALRVVSQLADADAAMIVLRQEEGEPITAAYGLTAEESDRDLLGVPPEAGKARAVKLGYLYTAEEAANDEFRLSGGLAVPLAGEHGGRSGTLAVFWRRADRAIADDELERFEELAATFGPALENARLYSEARRLAETDPLTNLRNRRYFNERLRRECARARRYRSEEHTSELQSRGHLVCRLLLEKKNE